MCFVYLFALQEVGSGEINDLPPDSPTIQQMVTHYRDDQSAKRKLEDSLNGTPAKKAKMNGAKAAKESSDDSSDESEEEKVVAKPAPKAVPGIFYKIFINHIVNLKEFLKTKFHVKLSSFKGSSVQGCGTSRKLLLYRNE